MDDVDQRHHQLLLAVAEEGRGLIAPHDAPDRVEPTEDLVRHLQENGQVVVSQLCEGPRLTPGTRRARRTRRGGHARGA